MIGLIQRVSHTNVVVDSQEVGIIQEGILALIGIEKTDNLANGKKLIDRILSYRVHNDVNGKMNLSLKDIHGGLMLVPQFTLVADTKKGTRPGFSRGMPPHEGEILFNQVLEYAKSQYDKVATGRYGANMQVSLCNNGPATFILNC